MFDPDSTDGESVSKFRMKMKLQGLELEIEGSRDDASVMTHNIGQQIAGLLRPVSSIIEGNEPQDEAPRHNIISLPAESPGKKTKRRKQPSLSQANGDDHAKPVDFKHAPEKFGNPKQEWVTAEKSLWLLYVVNEIANVGELTARSLAETFNKHFRQAGLIKTGNVKRDLGRLKGKAPTPVGEDTTKSPTTWFLTEEGRKQAQSLVSSALGQAG